jgi:hypothetical protein
MEEKTMFIQISSTIRQQSIAGHCSNPIFWGLFVHYRASRDVDDEKPEKGTSADKITTCPCYFAFITVVILSIMRWPRNTHLLIIWNSCIYTLSNAWPMLNLKAGRAYILCVWECHIYCCQQDFILTMNRICRSGIGFRSYFSGCFPLRWVSL